MNPVLLKLGPFQVHWYGLLIVLGAATLGATRLIDNVDVVKQDGRD